jgi:uncharacterized membrane protein YidH (DUF202 family)
MRTTTVRAPATLIPRMMTMEESGDVVPPVDVVLLVGIVLVVVDVSVVVVVVVAFCEEIA